MFINNISIPADSDKKHSLISFLLLSGLLILRFPFLIGLSLGAANISPVVQFLGLLIFEGGTYLLTAILIWWEREHLKDFWIDLASAITFLCQMFYFLIGLGLFWAMRRARAKFPMPSTNVWRWVLVGAALAILCEIFIVNSPIEPPQAHTLNSASAGFIFLIPALFIQTTNAAVWEEPLFRGFLWGYLRRAGWKDIWIWPFQAILFTLGHVYYLQNEALGPWLIRMMVPSLVIGFIAWQAKSVFASMVTHGMFNAIHDMLAHTRSLSEAMQVSWSAVLIIMAIFTGLWIAEWLKHRQIAATG